MTGGTCGIFLIFERTIYVIKPSFIFSGILFLCLLLSTNARGQLTGTVTLDGQINHNGIKVKFVPNFGGMLDSCFTNSAGIYSINITTGNYRVWFSYPGFQTIFHSAEYGPQLSNSSTIPLYKINAGTAVYVSGAVSGTWTQNNTYYIENSALVAENTTLSIQPGTTIKFIGLSSLLVRGRLIANGSPGQRILFTSYAGNWDGIVIINSGSAVIDFCIVELAANGIRSSATELVISNNILLHNNFNIQLDEGPAKVENNEIYNFVTGVGISTGYNSTATISCNHIYNPDTVANYAVGIRTQTCNLVVNNHIYGLLYGIEIAGYGNPIIQNNYVHNNKVGINLRIDNRGLPLIVNNTLENNDWFGLSGYDISKETKFINNIVTGSDTAVFLNDTLIFENNLFYNCITDFSTFLFAPGVGQIIGTNNNGDSVDANNNIFENPLFVNGQAPYLQTGSPVLNAGNVIYSLDIGVNPNKICYSNLSAGWADYSWQSIETLVFPNPTSDGSLTVRSTILLNAYEIYDNGGCLVKSVKGLAGYSFDINLSTWQKGLYFIKLISSSGMAYRKIIYN